jgi:hypothetical protein
MMRGGGGTMIAAIGFMVGCYILVRMAALMTRPPARREHSVVRVLALLTCVVTVITMVYLWVGPQPTLR